MGRGRISLVLENAPSDDREEILFLILAFRLASRGDRSLSFKDVAIAYQQEKYAALDIDRDDAAEFIRAIV